jgi:predicted Rossmann-fold nucleotide-binding protein
LDETFEVLTWKQVGLHGKPIVIVDTLGYWSGLFDVFFNHMIEHGFVRKEDLSLFTIVSRVEDILPAIANAPEANKDFVSKWG